MSRSPAALLGLLAVANGLVACSDRTATNEEPAASRASPESVSTKVTPPVAEPAASGQPPEGDHRTEGSEQPPQELRIGVLDGPKELVFGEIADLAVDRGGNIYVLDDKFHEVKVFSPEGVHRFTFGREGRGPGEFGHPTDIRVEEDEDGSVVLVTDDRLRLVSFFNAGADGKAPEFTRAWPTTYHSQSVCVADGRLYLTSGRPEGVIHHADSSGVLRSMVAPISLVDDEGIWNDPKFAGTARIFQNWAWMDCTDQAIFLLNWNVPLVRAFSLEGDSLWATGIPGYERSRIKRTSPNAVAFLPGSDTVGYVGKGITVGSDGNLWVTVLKSDRERRLSYVLYRLDPATGVIEGSAPSPAVITHVGERVYGYRNDPFPQVVILSDLPLLAPIPPD